MGFLFYNLLSNCFFFLVYFVLLISFVFFSVFNCLKWVMILFFVGKGVELVMFFLLGVFFLFVGESVFFFIGVLNVSWVGVII